MKAQGISMSMLVVIAIAVLVLVIVAVFFSGGFRRLGGDLIETSEGMADTDVGQLQMLCNQRCAQIELEGGTCSCSACGDGNCDTGETNFTCPGDGCP